jgi:hypothetical protein
VIQFDEDCRKLANLVGIPEIKENDSDSSQDVKGIVNSWLESEASGNWVLVLDNADNKDDFFSDSAGNSSPGPGLAKYIPSCAKGIIVITTRDRTVAVQLAGPRNVLGKKEAMDPTETDALFKYHFPSGAPYQDTSYIQLLEELQRLPLVVTQVASYLETNHGIITPSQYLQSFRSTKESQSQLLSTHAFNNIWRRNKDVSETLLTTELIEIIQSIIQPRLFTAMMKGKRSRKRGHPQRKPRKPRKHK